jgi:predicted RecA/RadA family phage recombinase
MALTRFLHNGDTIDYTPTVEVAVGDVVVLGELVGVANRNIQANTPGGLTVTGVIDFPKATGGGSGIAFGSKVYWDAAAKQATTNAASGANKLIGKTVHAAADADATACVRLSQ